MSAPRSIVAQATVGLGAGLLVAALDVLRVVLTTTRLLPLELIVLVVLACVAYGAAAAAS